MCRMCRSGPGAQQDDIPARRVFGSRLCDHHLVTLGVMNMSLFLPLFVLYSDGLVGFDWRVVSGVGGDDGVVCIPSTRRS